MRLGVVTVWMNLACLALLCGGAAAQEVVPRRWSHLPTGLNFAGVATAYTTGDISFDPVLQVEQGTVDLSTFAGTYIRSFTCFGRAARVDLKAAYQTGEWKGLLGGEPASAPRSGMADPSVRFAVNLYGAPPLQGQAFREYRAAQDTETIVGAGLVIQLPLGEYFEDRLINLGSNRYTFRPQLGVVHTRGRWTGELTGAVWFWTDNDEYWNGNTLEQYPMLAGQGHVIYSWRPGLWASASGAYGYGGEAKVNGERKNNRTENLLYALSVGLPLNPRAGLTFSWIGARTQFRTGADTDTLSAACSYLW